MKRLLKIIISIIVLVCVITNVRSVQAQGNFNDFPYEGTYVTDEDNAIVGYEFDHTNKTITIITQYSNRQMDRYLKLINMIPNNLLLDSLLDPSVSSEQIEAMRQQWGIDNLDLSEIYLETADDVESWMTYSDVLELLAQKIPGFHAISDDTFIISQAEIKQSQDLWIVNLFNVDRILRFEIGSDTQTITDDYGVTYNLIEEDDTNE